MEDDFVVTTLSPEDHSAIANQIVNLQEARARAQKTSDSTNEFEEGLSLIGKITKHIKPLRVVLGIVTGLVFVGWSAYGLIHEYATKDFVKDTLQKHSNLPHAETDAKIRVLQTDVEDIDSNVEDLTDNAKRDDKIQRLQMLRTKYVEDLAEYNARGRRGKKPAKDPMIDALELELLN